MPLATSYFDLAGRCQIRPISDADLDRLAIPRLPEDALMWLYQNPDPIGMGGLMRVAGKPDEAELLLLMRSDRHLARDGARMLNFLLTQAKEHRFKRVVGLSESEQTAYAKLLARNGFRQAYEEWDLWRALPYRGLKPQFRLQTLPEAEGAALLRRLYDESFADTRWYLPYTSDSHLLDDFGVDSDFLFLFVGDKPVGFAGVKYVDKSAEIEIFGITKAYRSRHYGQSLAHSLLHYLTAAGYQDVVLSLWKDNAAGLHLAQLFDFNRIQSRIYMEYTLSQGH